MEYEEVYLWRHLLSMYFLYSIMNNRKSFWSGTFYLRSEKVRLWEAIVHPAFCLIPTPCFHILPFSVLEKRHKLYVLFKANINCFISTRQMKSCWKEKHFRACSEHCKNNFSWGMSQKWHIWKWRKTEEATASLWSSVKLFMVRWCHPDLTGMPCLNKQPCGMPESDPRQNQRMTRRHVQTPSQTKHCMKSYFSFLF